MPPEQCPVLPEITQTTRRELFDTAQNEAETHQPIERALSTILEVPEWAFRLEQRLVASEATEQLPELSPKKVDTPQERGVGERDSESPEEQGWLF